jgi:5'(3')-deoxyribonucleotidase
LPPDKETPRIVSALQNLFGEYRILTSPLRGDHENSRHWKKEWCKKYLKYQPIEFLVVGDKSKILNNIPKPLRKYHILIDDRISNINKWLATGGAGILCSSEHNSPYDLLKELTLITQTV